MGADITCSPPARHQFSSKKELSYLCHLCQSVLSTSPEIRVIIVLAYIVEDGAWNMPVSAEVTCKILSVPPGAFPADQLCCHPHK